ncbi:MAG TPA: hypothetical protein VGX25_19320 [Actinophytocola sp.]|uniref:hypothetical protein n=1 Tax=Actinophytocola sp. TaxID=1872138 RepID=UPI002DDC9573|nr:hypothetical protein [Actinophytocola sp.]HEV2781539.1 hypothetical protein [Actinophytocola sp.]
MATVELSRPVVLDFLERAGWSAGQVFFATLLAGGAVSVTNLPWKYASVLALSAGVASLVLTLGQYLADLHPSPNLPAPAVFWIDLGLRLVKTFLATLAGAFVAAEPFDVTTFDWPAALNLAALAVLAALAKGLLARGSDSGMPAQAAPRMTPSTLPTRTYLEAVAPGALQPAAGSR